MKLSMCYCVPNGTLESSFGYEIDNELELFIVTFQRLKIKDAAILSFVDSVENKVYSQIFYNDDDRLTYILDAYIGNEPIRVMVATIDNHYTVCVNGTE